MAKTLWHLSKEQTILKEFPVSDVPNTFITIKALYSLISAGTERLVASGRIPKALFHTMRVPYMEGSFDFPLSYGYALIGQIVESGHPQEGQIVHLMHPHQNYCKVALQDCFTVPEGVPPARASLASNLETALNAIWDSEISIGDKALVVGFGMIGALVARLLSLLPAVEVIILEPDAQREAKAREMGFTCWSKAPSDYFDFAFHSSGTGAGLQTSIDAVGLEGKVIELSWYGDKNISLELGGSFHQARKQIISSQVSKIPGIRGPRWSYKRRKETVFELLKQDYFDQHLTDCIPFEAAPAFFDELRKGAARGLGYYIKY